MSVDILIRGGKLIDGSGNPWFKADIAVKNGKIVEISRVPISGGARIIDAKGLVVCPGFIDLHSHSDSTIVVHNRCESSLHMGLTTMAVGQCGGSAWPVIDKNRESTRLRIASSTRTPIDQIVVDWSTLTDYRATLEKRGIGANLVPQVGFGTIRTLVMGREGEGGERYEPTDDEIRQMRDYVVQSMEDGAFGLTTGLKYAPQRNAFTDEVVELVKVVAKYGGYYISHMRSESDALIEACKELIEICERTGVRGCYSHHKAMLPENWGKPSETMRLIDRARERGVEIYCDQYCQLYAAESNLGACFVSQYWAPKPVTPPPVSKLLADIEDPQKWKVIRNAARRVYEQQASMNEDRKKALEKKFIKPGEIWNPETFYYIVHSKTHPELIGKNLREVAQALGLADYLEAIRRVWLDDEGHTYVANGGMCEEDIITILKHPTSSVSTDASTTDGSPSMLKVGGLQHPRGWGVYAKVLGRYVRDMQVLSLEEAIRKMTSLPIQFLGLKDRGMLREGYWADIVVFDPANIRDNSTFANPCRHPSGIPYVIVNGKIVIEEGKHTGALPGKVLLHKA